MILSCTRYPNAYVIPSTFKVGHSAWSGITIAGERFACEEGEWQKKALYEREKNASTSGWFTS